jgi:methylated-DNA-[protein]-cysteine S-methyltransferase
MSARLSFSRIAAPDPIGAVLLASDGRGLVCIDYGVETGRFAAFLTRRFGPEYSLEPAEDPQGCASALRAYLGGRLDALDDLPTNAGGSPFQRRVWAILRAIPPGTTRSYGSIATELGQPGASRAVGLANGSNPINLVVPCHRVIGSGGALTGYGGGIDRKRWLLAHEARFTAAGRGELALA